MLRGGDVSRSDTRAAQRAGPTQKRGCREHCEALGFTVEPQPLQVHRVSAARSSVGIRPPRLSSPTHRPPKTLGCKGAEAEGDLLKAVRV